MSRKLKHADVMDVHDVDNALHYLRDARTCLKNAGATKSLERVRKAIKSCEGALRHVERRRQNTERTTPS